MDEQLVMRSALDDTPFVHHHDPIRVVRGVQPMGDRDDRPAGEEFHSTRSV